MNTNHPFTHPCDTRARTYPTHIFMYIPNHTRTLIRPHEHTSRPEQPLRLMKTIFFTLHLYPAASASSGKTVFKTPGFTGVSLCGVGGCMCVRMCVYVCLGSVDGRDLSACVCAPIFSGGRQGVGVGVRMPVQVWMSGCGCGCLCVHTWSGCRCRRGLCASVVVLK